QLDWSESLLFSSVIAYITLGRDVSCEYSKIQELSESCKLFLLSLESFVGQASLSVWFAEPQFTGNKPTTVALLIAYVLSAVYTIDSLQYMTLTSMNRPPHCQRETRLAPFAQLGWTPGSETTGIKDSELVLRTQFACMQHQQKFGSVHGAVPKHCAEQSTVVNRCRITVAYAATFPGPLPPPSGRLPSVLPPQASEPPITSTRTWTVTVIMSISTSVISLPSHGLGQFELKSNFDTSSIIPGHISNICDYTIDYMSCEVLTPRHDPSMMCCLTSASLDSP
ncbi:hypothetical protein STEG23_031582, partial [Scotinomys teguina]